MPSPKAFTILYPHEGHQKHHQMALFFFSRMLHTWSSTNSIQHLRFWNPSPQTWKQIWKQQKTTTALIKSTPSPQAETISDISGEAILRPHGFCRTTNLLVVIPVGIPGLRDGISGIRHHPPQPRQMVGCCRLLSLALEIWRKLQDGAPQLCLLVYKPH